VAEEEAADSKAYTAMEEMLGKAAAKVRGLGLRP
jgi:hypothetical protein